MHANPNDTSEAATHGALYWLLIPTPGPVLCTKASGMTEAYATVIMT